MTGPSTDESGSSQKAPKGEITNYGKRLDVTNSRAANHPGRCGSKQRPSKASYFDEGNPNLNWHVINKGYWGIDQLRNRLRTLLYEQTKGQLPKDRKDITVKDRFQSPDQLWTKYNKEYKEIAVTTKIGVDSKHNHLFYGNYDADPSRDLHARIEESYKNVFRRRCSPTAMTAVQWVNLIFCHCLVFVQHNLACHKPYSKDSLEKQKDRARQTRGRQKTISQGMEPGSYSRNDRLRKPWYAIHAMRAIAKVSEDHQTARNGAWETPMAFVRSSKPGTSRQSAIKLADDA
ncbi:hypothetical protein V8E54_002800 [Elaphomyces granulatus]